MHLLLILLSSTLHGYAECRSTYDQSQTGHINVQVDLKDLEIIALLNGEHEEYYEDIDYAYDYSEMTIKPQSGTTKKPLNVTTVADNMIDNATIATTVNIEQTTEPIRNSTWENSEKLDVTQHAIFNESDAVEVTTKTPSEAGTISQSNKTKDIVTTIKSEMDMTTKIYEPDVTSLAQSPLPNEYNTTMSSADATSTKRPSISANSTNCRKGFISNQKGGCDLKLQSMSNALLKIVKLSQKLKSRRHNRGNGRDAV